MSITDFNMSSIMESTDVKETPVKKDHICSYCKKTYIKKNRYNYHLLTCKIKSRQDFIIQSRLEELKQELHLATTGNEDNIQLQVAVEFIKEKIDNFSQESSDIFTETSTSWQKLLEQKNIEIFTLKEKIEDKDLEIKELNEMLENNVEDNDEKNDEHDEHDELDDHKIVDLVIKTGESEFNMAENFQALVRMEKNEEVKPVLREKIKELATLCKNNAHKSILLDLVISILKSERELILIDDLMCKSLNAEK